MILDLENIEVKIEDEDQVVILLNSLPKPFNLLKDAPQYSKDKLSLEGLISAIYSKEIDLRIESKDANIREGLSAQGRSKKMNGNGKNNHDRCHRHKLSPKFFTFMQRLEALQASLHSPHKMATRDNPQKVTHKITGLQPQRVFYSLPE